MAVNPTAQPHNQHNCIILNLFIFFSQNDQQQQKEATGMIIAQFKCAKLYLSN